MFLIDAHHLGAKATGNETWIRNCIRAWADSEAHNIYAVTRSGASELKRLISEPKYVTVNARPTWRLASDLPHFARRCKAKALLVQYTLPLTSTPSVVMVHDLSPLDSRASDWLSRRSRLRYVASIQTSVRFASGLLTPSEFTKQQLVEKLSVDAGRVTVAPNAVDFDLAKLLRASGEPSPNTKQILVVGNLVPRKNVITVARAVAALRLGGVDCKLRIVGGVQGNGLSLAEAIRKLLGNSVSFSGYVSTRQLATEYLGASILAFPSAFEGFGIPILEAMTAGLPVAASANSSIPEVAGGAAHLVDTFNVSAWTDTLSLLLSNSSVRRAAIAKGEQRVAAYDWRYTADVVTDALTRASM